MKEQSLYYYLGVTVNYVTIIGIMWVICPVISNAITETEMECVTAPENAAAPTVAYPPESGIDYQVNKFHTEHDVCLLSLIHTQQFCRQERGKSSVQEDVGKACESGWITFPDDNGGQQVARQIVCAL